MKCDNDGDAAILLAMASASAAGAATASSASAEDPLGQPPRALPRSVRSDAGGCLLLASPSSSTTTPFSELRQSRSMPPSESSSSGGGRVADADAGIGKRTLKKLLRRRATSPIPGKGGSRGGGNGGDSGTGGGGVRSLRKRATSPIPGGGRGGSNKAKSLGAAAAALRRRATSPIPDPGGGNDGVGDGGRGSGAGSGNGGSRMKSLGAAKAAWRRKRLSSTPGRTGGGRDDGDVTASGSDNNGGGGILGVLRSRSRPKGRAEDPAAAGATSANIEASADTARKSSAAVSKMSSSRSSKTTAFEFRNKLQLQGGSSNPRTEEEETADVFSASSSSTSSTSSSSCASSRDEEEDAPDELIAGSASNDASNAAKNKRFPESEPVASSAPSSLRPDDIGSSGKSGSDDEASEDAGADANDAEAKSGKEDRAVIARSPFSSLLRRSFGAAGIGASGCWPSLGASYEPAADDAGTNNADDDEHASLAYSPDDDSFRIKGCLGECSSPPNAGRERSGASSGASASDAHSERHPKVALPEDIGDDPTAQESIECVFSSRHPGNGNEGEGGPDFFPWGSRTGITGGTAEEGDRGSSNNCTDVRGGGGDVRSGGGDVRNRVGWRDHPAYTGSSRVWSARRLRRDSSGGLVFIGTRRRFDDGGGGHGEGGGVHDSGADESIADTGEPSGAADDAAPILRGVDDEATFLSLLDGDVDEEEEEGATAESAADASAATARPEQAAAVPSSSRRTGPVDAESGVRVRCDRPCPFCSSAAGEGTPSSSSSSSSSKQAGARSRRVPPPHVPPRLWPQGTILLRPTPGRGMRVIGVRYSGERTYLWSPSNSESSSGGRGNGEKDNESAASSWWDGLRDEWSRDDPALPSPPPSSDSNSSAPPSPGCPECCILPVNNGNEAPGKSLVIDFESSLFAGTLLLRIRNSSGTTPRPYDDTKGYFAGMNRRYQAVIRGRFTTPNIPMTECVTGQRMDRKFGKLPPRLVLKGALRVVGFFAPQLRARLDGPEPSVVSPLGSAPQSITVRGMLGKDGREARQNDIDVDANRSAKNLAGGKDDDGDGDESSLEGGQSEPADLLRNLLNDLPLGCVDGKAGGVGAALASAPTSVARARVRKKAFDRLYASSASSSVSSPSSSAKGSGKEAPFVPAFRTDAVYTFEFLQHLLDFDDLSVDLGSMLGKVKLADTLDGQPVRFLAAWEKTTKKRPSAQSSSSSSTGSTRGGKKAKNGGSGGGGSSRQPANETEAIWSFDIWHRCLYEDAVRHDQKGGMDPCS